MFEVNWRQYITVDNYNKLTVFLLTSIGYGVVHCNRKAFSTVKYNLIEAWTAENNTSPYVMYPVETWSNPSFDSDADAAKFMGILDFLFMFAYAIGLYISGYIADKTNTSYVFSIGMILASIDIIMFGVFTEKIHFYNKVYYGFLWFFNGLIQSSSWPAAIGLMGNWFKGGHGLIFGLWSSCTNVGNIIAGILCGYTIEYGYDITLLISANVMIGFGIICFLSIEPYPEKLRTLSLLDETDGNEESSSAEVETRNVDMTFRQILFIPGVILYSLAYACIKLVNYALFFWLPLYLSLALKWDAATASKVSSLYDLGGIFGAIISGLLSDIRYKCFSKHCVTYTFLVLCIPAFILYRFTPGNPISLNGFMMFLLGFLMGGPVTIISTVFSASLTSTPEYRGKKIISTVSGIIDGTGSFGAALGQIFIPMLGYSLGWYSIFYLFVTCLIICMLLVLPILIRDIKLHNANQRDNVHISSEHLVRE